MALDAGRGGDVGQHFFTRQVAVVAPVGFEGGGGVGHQLALVERREGAAHAFDAVHRKDLGREDDAEVVEPCPVGEVLQHVGLLPRIGLGAVVVDRLVDGVEHSADQNGLPRNFRAEFGGERLHGVKSEIGPGAGAIEVEVELARHFVSPPLVRLVDATSDAYLANP